MNVPSGLKATQLIGRRWPLSSPCNEQSAVCHILFELSFPTVTKHLPLGSALTPLIACILITFILNHWVMCPKDAIPSFESFRNAIPKIR